MGRKKKHRFRMNANLNDGAQDVLRCDVCSEIEWEKSPAEVHCSTCHENICSPCVAKHMTSNDSKKHDIVLLHSANMEVDMPNCTSHSTLKCELFCKECIAPICLKCLSSNHNCHPVEEITKLCVAIRADIQKNTEKLKTELIPRFEKLAASEEGKAKQLTQAYEIFESAIENHGQKIHKAVDAVITKYKAKAQLMSQTDAQILQQQREDINRLLSETKKEAAQNELLERSNNVTELMAFKTKPRNVPIQKNIMIPPVFTPKPVSDDVVESLFGPIPDSLVVVAQETPSLITSNKHLLAIETIRYFHQTPYKQLLKVASTSLFGVWTSGSETILSYIDTFKGSVLESITLPTIPIDICTNYFEKLFVCNLQTVYIKEIGSKLKRCFSAPFGWCVQALASSKVTIPATVFTSGIQMNLLMFLRREDYKESKVVRVAGSLSTMCEFQYDHEGKQIYNSNCSEYFLTENINGDICVSDTKTLVVIDKLGNLRFRYHGKVSDTFNKPFTPMGVTTDPRGNILLTDLENRCIHLLDQNGNFVRCITCNGSLDKVCDISCNTYGDVFVAERDTAKFKYLEYQ